MNGDSGKLDLSRCRILVVEDMAPNLRLLQVYLETLKVGRVVAATNGREGLEALEREDFDLVVLDIMMPEMDGFEMLRHLRADARWRDLPVLAQTALGAVDERVEVFRAGATDLVTKPINTQEFLARVRIHLENRVLVRSLREFQARLSADLEIAVQTQDALLPTEDRISAIEGQFGIQLDSHAEPSAELGGDIWGVFPLDGDRLVVYSADFSGHGVNAALNTLRLHTLMDRNPPGLPSPATCLTSLGATLTSLLPIEQYATMFLGVIDFPARRLIYATAGAPTPILGDGTADGIRLLEGGGLPLGIVTDWSYEDREEAFGDGAFLFLFSDALFESPTRAGPALEEEGVLELVRAATAAPSHRPPLDRLIEGFRSRVLLPIPDDLTAIWLTRLPR